MPVALNCCLPPAVTFALAGVTLIEVNFAWNTVTVALPLMPKSVAVTVVEPTATVETRPALLVAFDTLATDGSVTAQATCVVRIWVVPF